MEYILNLLAGGLGAGIVAFLLKNWVIERIKQSVAHEYDKKLEKLKADIQSDLLRRQEIWMLKRDACLKALNLANAVLSNYHYPNVKKEDITPQYESVANARSCVNELACTCEKPDVLEELKEIMFGEVRPDAIVDLRNAVRRELGFSQTEIDTDRKKAFIGKLNCSPPKTNKSLNKDAR